MDRLSQVEATSGNFNFRINLLECILQSLFIVQKQLGRSLQNQVQKIPGWVGEGCVLGITFLLYYLAFFWEWMERMKPLAGV